MSDFKIITDEVILPSFKKKSYPSRILKPEVKRERQLKRWNNYNKSRTKEKIREQNVKAWKKRKDDPEKLAKIYEVVKKYNLQKLEKLAGRSKSKTCEICNKLGKICFDHCHNKNKFRGWICDACNRIIGIAKDDPNVLRKCANYLEQKYSDANEIPF